MKHILYGLLEGIRYSVHTGIGYTVYVVVNSLKYVIALAVALLMAYLNQFDLYTTCAAVALAVAVVIFVENFIYFHIYLESGNFSCELYAVMVFMVGVLGFGGIQAMNLITIASMYDLVAAVIVLGTSVAYSIFIKN